MSDLSLYYSTDALKLYLISSVVIVMVASWLVSSDKELKEQKVTWRIFIAICCIYIITIAVTKYDESRLSFEAKTNHDISLEVSRSLTLRCIKELGINEEEMNSENTLDKKLNKLVKCQLEGINEINKRLILQRIAHEMIECNHEYDKEQCDNELITKTNFYKEHCYDKWMLSIK